MRGRSVVHRCGFLSRIAVLTTVVAAALLAVGPTSALADSQSPVAAFSFDEIEGATAQDAIEEGPEATLEGAESTPHGKYGAALKFDGEDDCVTLSGEPALDLSEEFTLEAWVRPEGRVAHDPVIVGESGGIVSYALGVGIPHEGKGEGVIDATGGAVHVHSAGSLDEDAWTHLAVTFDGARLRLYKEGALVTEERVSEADVPTSGTITIGCDPHYGTHFEGRIDEVRIYDRDLGEAEVQADMEAPIQTPKTGPVAEYSFDEGSEETVEDLSGDGHTATVEGAKVARGRYGKGIELDGESGCVSIPASSELEYSEEFSVEAWVRPEGSGEEAHPVITQEVSGVGEGEEPYSYELLAGEDQAPKAWVRKPGTGFQGVYGESDLPEHAWSHVALTDDGGEIRLYVDGSLVDSEASPALTPGTGDLKIGCGTVDGTFQGRIDEVRVYDRAITPAEVEADMEAPIQTPKTGPVAEYSFDEVEPGDETAQDLSGDGHTATIEGAEPAPGRYGKGLEFDGREDCVSIPVDEELEATEEFTVEAWVRPEGSGEKALPVIAMDDEGSEPGEQEFAYELFAGQDAAPKGWVRKGHEPGEWDVLGEEPLPEKTWSHVALTDDGNVIRLYVDGVLGKEENSTDVAPPLTLAEGPLTIGCGIEAGGYKYFKGRIDEVRVYDRALDGPEVDADAEAPIETPRQGPVAAYSFDEGEGETVEDLSGDGNTATIHGTEWTEHGKYGGAIEFPAGKESYLSVPDSPELDPTEEFTLEAWVRPDSGNGKYAPLIAKSTPGSRAEPYFLYEGSWEEDLPYGGLEGETDAETDSHAKEKIPDDTWTNLAMTFDGSKTRFFVNGELVDEAAGTLTKTSDGELLIGADGHGDFFSGRIDELRIYDRALTSAEVAEGMEAPLETPRREPIAWYPFDAGKGSTAEDISGFENEGTITGATWGRGKYGDAMEFAGTAGECVTVPHASSLALAEEATVEAWVKSPELDSGRVLTYGSLEESGVELSLSLNEQGKPAGKISTSSHTWTVASSLPLEAHVWSHLALTYDGAYLKLYINGELVASGAVEGLALGPDGPFDVGCNAATTEAFTGRIDEVKLYDRSLSAPEIISDMRPHNLDVVEIGEDEEGYFSKAEMELTYPQQAEHRSHSVPTLVLHVTSLGPIPAEPLIMASRKGPSGHYTVEGRPYKFTTCLFEQRGVGYPAPDPTEFTAFDKEIVREPVAQNCHGTYSKGTITPRWAVSISGHFSYKYGTRVWVEHAPNCKEWGSPITENEEREIEREELEGVKHPKELQTTNYRPYPAENCYQSREEGTASTNGLDVIGNWIWKPTFYEPELAPLSHVCGVADGHLPISPPYDQLNGEWALYETGHFYRSIGAPKGHPQPWCNWEHPGNSYKVY